MYQGPHRLRAAKSVLPIAALMSLTIGLAGAPALASQSHETGSGGSSSPSDQGDGLSGGSSGSDEHAAGHVYAATNESAAGGNSIVVFDRGSDGRLTQAGTYPTGGSGSGAPAGSGFEQSQNGVILGGQPGADTTQFKDLLFAVNAGSDSITVFRTSTTAVDRDL